VLRFPLLLAVDLYFSYLLPSYHRIILTHPLLLKLTVIKFTIMFLTVTMLTAKDEPTSTIEHGADAEFFPTRVTTLLPVWFPCSPPRRRRT